MSFFNEILKELSKLIEQDKYSQSYKVSIEYNKRLGINTLDRMINTYEIPEDKFQAYRYEFDVKNN